MELFEELRKVRGSDVDFKNRLKLNALFNYMSDAAWVHAEKLYLGYSDLLNAGYFWVLSWARVEIDRYPKFGNIIKIQTWPQMLHKRFVIRDFLFSDAITGKTLGRGRTAWLLVDQKNKRSVDPNQTGLAFQFCERQPVMTNLPERIPVNDFAVSVCSKKVAYSDLDVNRHVNNARYVEFLMDAYPSADFEARQISSFTISYLAESRYGMTLEISKCALPGAPETDYAAAEIADSGTLAVQSLVTWRDRQ